MKSVEIYKDRFIHLSPLLQDLTNRIASFLVQTKRANLNVKTSRPLFPLYSSVKSTAGFLGSLVDMNPSYCWSGYLQVLCRVKKGNRSKVWLVLSATGFLYRVWSRESFLSWMPILLESSLVYPILKFICVASSARWLRLVEKQKRRALFQPQNMQDAEGFKRLIWWITCRLNWQRLQCRMVSLRSDWGRRAGTNVDSIRNISLRHCGNRTDATCNGIAYKSQNEPFEMGVGRFDRITVTILKIARYQIMTLSAIGRIYAQ